MINKIKNQRLLYRLGSRTIVQRRTFFNDIEEARRRAQKLSQNVFDSANVSVEKASQQATILTESGFDHGVDQMINKLDRTVSRLHRNMNTPNTSFTVTASANLFGMSLSISVTDTTFPEK